MPRFPPPISYDLVFGLPHPLAWAYSSAADLSAWIFRPNLHPIFCIADRFPQTTVSAAVPSDSFPLCSLQKYALGRLRTSKIQCQHACRRDGIAARIIFFYAHTLWQSVHTAAEEEKRYFQKKAARAQARASENPVVVLWVAACMCNQPDVVLARMTRKEIQREERAEGGKCYRSPGDAVVAMPRGDDLANRNGRGQRQTDQILLISDLCMAPFALLVTHSATPHRRSHIIFFFLSKREAVRVKVWLNNGMTMPRVDFLALLPAAFCSSLSVR